ncbi:hypothetical protein [Proteus mirabilis]|uniref:hypothetical protein n=1 Tax=Proteus mirabilis TaxID=584 RepID=UPI0029F1F7C1|nr:hypothetical protein [Proteus mirabilis]
MSKDYDTFLKEKIIEIKISLSNQCTDMYELIGSVHDLFSSVYTNKLVANKNVIEELWDVLLSVFLKSNFYENRYDAIFAMSDIHLYAKKLKINLELDAIRKWRNSGNTSNSTEEILECVDDILT